MKKYFKIEVYSYGGETVMGTVSKEQYDYWIQKEQENAGSIGEYFSEFEFDPENTNKNVAKEYTNKKFHKGKYNRIFTKENTNKMITKEDTSTTFVQRGIQT